MGAHADAQAAYDDKGVMYSRHVGTARNMLIVNMPARQSALESYL